MAKTAKIMVCPDCRGSGQRTLHIGMKSQTYECGYCNCTGKVQYCPDCKGHGFVGGKTCERCKFRWGMIPAESAT